MTPEEVDTIIKVFTCCYASNGCIECPYNKDEYGDECMVKANEDILSALKRLKHLETPTEAEQPKLF